MQPQFSGSLVRNLLGCSCQPPDQSFDCGTLEARSQNGEIVTPTHIGFGELRFAWKVEPGKTLAPSTYKILWCPHCNSLSCLNSIKPINEVKMNPGTRSWHKFCELPGEHSPKFHQGLHQVEIHCVLSAPVSH